MSKQYTYRVFNKKIPFYASEKGTEKGKCRNAEIQKCQKNKNKKLKMEIVKTLNFQEIFIQSY